MSCLYVWSGLKQNVFRCVICFICFFHFVFLFVFHFCFCVIASACYDLIAENVAGGIYASGYSVLYRSELSDVGGTVLAAGYEAFYEGSLTTADAV